MAKLT